MEVEKMRPTAILIATLLATACGEEDDPVVPEKELTEKEAVGLLNAMVDIPAENGVKILHEDDDSTLVECQGGGRATTHNVSEKQEVKGDTVSSEGTYRVVPAGCRVPVPGDNFVVDGDPDVTYFNRVEIVRGGVTVTASAKGKVKWERDGEEEGSGDCSLDVSLPKSRVVVKEGQATIEGSFKGTLCGFSVTIDADDLIGTPTT